MSVHVCIFGRCMNPVHDSVHGSVHVLVHFLARCHGPFGPTKDHYRNSVARALESLVAFRRPQSNHLLMSACSPLSARDIAPGYSSNYKFFSKEHNLKFSKKFEKIAYYLYQKEFNINAEFSQYYYIKILSED